MAHRPQVDDRCVKIPSVLLFRLLYVDLSYQLHKQDRYFRSSFSPHLLFFVISADSHCSAVCPFFFSPLFSIPSTEFNNRSSFHVAAVPRGCVTEWCSSLLPFIFLSPAEWSCLVQRACVHMSTNGVSYL